MPDQPTPQTTPDPSMAQNQAQPLEGSTTAINQQIQQRAQNALAPAPIIAGGGDRYAKTVQDRADMLAGQQLINNVETAANPQERAQILINNKLTDADYQKLKGVVYPQTTITPTQSAAMAQAVEGRGGGESTDVGFFDDPITQTALAASGIGAGVKASHVVAGLLTYPLWNQEAQDVHNYMARTFPNNPRVVKAVDDIMPAVGVGVGAGLGALAPGEPPGGGDPRYARQPEATPTEPWDKPPSVEPAAAAPAEAAAGAAQPPETYPQGTVLDAQGQPVTSAPATASEAAPAVGGEPVPGATPEPAAPPAAPATPGAAPTAGEVPHTMAGMSALARATPMTQEQVRGLELSTPPAGEEGHTLLTTPVDAMDMLRLHFYAADQVNTALQDARLAQDYGNQDAAAEFAQVSKEFSDVTLPRWKAGLHQAGLTLRVLGDPASAESPAIREFANVAQGIQDSNAPLDRFMKAAAALPTTEERQALLERASGVDWTVPGAVQNLYVNSILSFNSVAKKAVSDIANIAWQVPTRALAQVGSRAAEVLTGADPGSIGVAPGETQAMTRAMVDNLGDSLRVGGRSFVANKAMFDNDVGFIDNKFGNSLLEGSGFENTWYGRAIDLYGHMNSLPGRSIMAVDQFSKSMQYNMEMYALAQRAGMQEAAAEGLTGADLAGRASEIAEGYIAKPPSQMVKQAMDTAKTNTFQADLEGWLSKADALRNSTFITRALFPFFKTPVNITLQGIRQSPLAPLSSVWRGQVAGGGADAALALSKTALGSTVLGYLGSKVLDGTITGGVPANLPRAQKQFWLSDHDPYSVKVGDTYHSYQSLEPLAWLLGATADIMPAFAYSGPNHADYVAYTLASAFASQIDHQPMWGALHQVMEVMNAEEKGKQQKFSGFVGKTAAGFVPSTIANFAGETDPVKRQTFTILDEFRNRIPWLRRDGLATLDPYGKPVIVQPGFAFNEFPAFTSHTKGANPVNDEQLRLYHANGFQPPNIPKSIGGPSDDESVANPQEKLYGATITPEESNRWMELRGNPQPGRVPELYDRLKETMQSEGYQNASDAVRANELHNIYTLYQRAAEGMLIAENPSVRLRIENAFQQKKLALQQPGATPAIAPAAAPAVGGP